MNVCLYMRYSSDRQTEQSIDGQRRVCMDFCKRNGYKVVEQYIDRATSAYKDTEKRVQFQKMIKDSDRQLWQAVVVYKLDRFSRNRYDSATYKVKLKKNGVRVISATENISDNPEGVILESVLEGMAEFYSKELSQKIKRGMKESAYKCHSTGGAVPLGYRIENKKFVIDETTAPIVKEAFALYAGGATVASICRTFNEKGYRTAQGAAFNKNSFRSMFKNERYIGIYKYKDIQTEGGIPAIVDKNTFNEVQRRLSLNAKAPARGKAKVDYMLSGKLFCGHCGHNMVGESGKGKSGNKYYYYTCSKRKRFHSCDKTPLKKEFIERAVAEDAVKILTPETIEELADCAIRQNKLDIKKKTLIPAIKKEIQDIERRIANIIKMIEKGAESESITTRLTELEDQKKAAETRLENEKGNIIILEKDHIVWWLSQFRDGDIDDEDFRRHIIDLLVNSVTVWDEPDGWFKITSVYNLTSTKTSTFKIPVGKCSDLSDILSPYRSRKSCSGIFY